MQYTLFANTGVQLIYTGLVVKPEYRADSWRPAHADRAWIQYRTTLDIEEPEIVLCIDTNTGDEMLHHFAKSEQAIQKPAIRLSLVELGVEEQIDITIRATDEGVGPQKGVALVLDFGNCRTMGLLVEDEEYGAHKLPATPFELSSQRARWTNKAEHRPQQTFESSFVLVSDPMPSVTVQVTRNIPPEYEMRPADNLLGRLLGRKKNVLVKPAETITEDVQSDLFPEISPVRLGKEVQFHKNKGYYTVAGSPTVGMSSPKRYLWSRQRLSNQYWHQFVPSGPRVEAARGPYFRYLYEDDRDWAQLPTEAKEFPPSAEPARPSYPKRAMMTACIYELLSQAHRQINSHEYRNRMSDPMRKRVLTDLVMSFPSGTSSGELERYRVQVRKAIDIFKHKHADRAVGELGLRMAIDEGTAGQLAYVYGELQAFVGAESWLRAVGRRDGSGQAIVRIASIDIGGGTSDLVIADYTDSTPGPFTNLKCQIRHIDGATKAGDDIREAVIQRVIIPQVANAVDLTDRQVSTLFESLGDPALAKQRPEFMTEVLIPAADRYLSLVNGSDGKDFALNDVATGPATLLKLRETIREKCGAQVLVGFENIRITYIEKEFHAILREVMHSALAVFCDAICRYDCDIVTLAGMPTSLKGIRDLISHMLPIPPHRLVPLGGYETGPWYPLPHPDRPGCIADPKSVVVVGAAIEYMSARQKCLGSLKVTVEKHLARPLTYWWGIVARNKRTFRNADALFQAGASLEQFEIEVALVGRETMLARRLSDRESSEPTPSYAIVVKNNVVGDSLRVRLRCTCEQKHGDEILELIGVTGQVAVNNGESGAVIVAAELGRDVELSPKGLIDEDYYLDSGVFFDIAYEKIRAGK